MNTTQTRAERHFVASENSFRENFDERCFEFRHDLCDSPLFEPERLVAIAKELSADPNDVYFDAGEIQIDQRWDQVPACDMTVEQLMYRIENANAWIILRKVDKLPEYARLLDACMSEIEALTGRNLRSVMKISNALIFITSPHRITSYHIDRECSCLMQIRGNKTISVFDRNDRDVLPEEEIERFWAVDNNAATYRPQLQARARKISLMPGGAVHLPVNAPHWVENGPEVSVSLNINFHYKDHVLGDVYRTNHWLRWAGFNPTPPRRSALLDRLKGTAYRSTHRIASSARRIWRER